MNREGTQRPEDVGSAPRQDSLASLEVQHIILA